jgi:hypothetical protein
VVAGIAWGLPQLRRLRRIEPIHEPEPG